MKFISEGQTSNIQEWKSIWSRAAGLTQLNNIKSLLLLTSLIDISIYQYISFFTEHEHRLEQLECVMMSSNWSCFQGTLKGLSGTCGFMRFSLVCVALALVMVRWLTWSDNLTGRSHRGTTTTCTQDNLHTRVRFSDVSLTVSARALTLFNS